MIFDCHVHLPSPGLGTAIEWAPFTPDVDAALRYLERCGVDKSVASSIRVTHAKTPEEVRAGNDETLAIAGDHPQAVTPGCAVNPNFVEEAVAELRRCHEEHGVVWVAELVGHAADFTYDTEDFYRVMATAAELDMVVQIHSEQPNAEEIDRLCAEFPKMPVALAHVGDSAQEVHARCQLAAKRSNLYLDLSGHGIQRMGVLDLAVQCAGPDRVLFGSDYTVNDPAAVIATIQASYLSDEAKAKVLGGNVLRLLQERGAK
jgi:predicted TIM-barrel fold metal-dependent hydrolase